MTNSGSALRPRQSAAAAIRDRVRRGGARYWQHSDFHGSRWPVRWREHDGRMRSRTFTSKRDAMAIDADVKARKFKGEPLPRASKDTLSDAYDQWLRLRGSNLAPQTLDVYKYAWDAHTRRAGFDSHRSAN